MTTQHEAPDGLVGLADLMRDDNVHVDSTEAVTRRRRRRWWGVGISTLVFVAIVASAGGYAAWALNAPLPDPVIAAAPPGAVQPEPTAAGAPSQGISAMSVSGADDYLGADASGIWTGTGLDEARPIASITKLVTALVILDRRPLASYDDPGPTLLFDEADNDLYDEYYVQGATIAEMPTGSSMPLRDALAVMLIPSASNYADVVSTWAFGSRAAFVRETRAWLDARGLTSTVIVEPTGMDPRNVSTPRDLIALGKIAAADPVVARIAASPSASTRVTGNMGNTNTLLGTAGITGLKTGNLGPGTFNLLYTATVDAGTGTPLQVVGVILGGYSRQSVGQDAVAALSTLRGGFRDVPVASAGQQVGTLTTPWGSSARLVIAQDTAVFSWSDTPVTVTMSDLRLEDFADGEVAGEVTWTAGPHSATASVVVDGDLAAPTDWWRLTHPTALG